MLFDARRGRRNEGSRWNWSEEIGRVGTVELTALFGGWLGECLL